MSLTVGYRPVARVEFDDAVAWYENARAGLGEEFANAVQSGIDEAAANPKRFPLVDGDLRECPVSGFPYCVYYRVRNGRLVVIAVFHQARDPSVWKGRA